MNCRCVLEFDDGKVLINAGERDIMKAENNSRPLAYGGRRERSYILNAEDIMYIKSEAKAINIPNDVLKFNEGTQTGFFDARQVIHIRGDIFPDEMSSDNRDLLSVRAVLAHEYYGHRPNRQQYLIEDSVTSDEERSRLTSLMWADEFRASYMAAKNAPGLTDEDRQYLIMDAISRAQEAGVSIRYNDFMRRVLNG